MKKLPLELVPKPDASVPKPPRKLGVLALSVWNRVLTEYVIDDAAGSFLFPRFALLIRPEVKTEAH